MFPIWNKLCRLFSGLVGRRRPSVPIRPSTLRREPSRRRRRRLPLRNVSSSVSAEMPDTSELLDTGTCTSTSQSLMPLTPQPAQPQPEQSTHVLPTPDLLSPELPLPILPPSVPPTPPPLMPAEAEAKSEPTPEPSPSRIFPTRTTTARLSQCRRVQRDMIRKAWQGLSIEEKTTCCQQTTNQLKGGSRSRRRRRSSNDREHGEEPSQQPTKTIKKEPGTDQKDE